MPPATASVVPTPPPSSSGIPGDAGEVLKNWSSLIGITTAIVGNMLIALALNVQRYAHTRLHKERVRQRHEARAALKRADTRTQTGAHAHANGDASASGNTGHATPPRAYGAIGPDSRLPPADAADTDHGDLETDPLAASYQSAATNDADTAAATRGDKDAASSYLKSPYWWLGQILITLGETGNFLAYGFAPASIVSPLGVVALISNCIIAPVMFHERFRPRDFWGVVIAVAGVVTVVLSANQEETKLEPHDVWDAITSLEFEIYLAVTILLITLLMWASSSYGRRTILIDLGLVGLFGGYTALATKGVSSMLSSTLWRAFATPVTYVLILILLVTAVMQIRYVNRALQRFDSTQVIPIQFVLFTLCVILGSAILYRDFEKTSAEQAAKFVGGCLLTFFGVFLITSGRKPQNDDEDLLSEADGIEETIGLRQHEAANGTGPTNAVPTSTSTSRRSSRVSRASFADPVKAGLIPDEPEGTPFMTRLGAESAPDVLVGDEPSSLVENPWQEPWDPPVQTPPHGSRMLATDSAVASASVNFFPATPTKDLSRPLSYPTDRSATLSYPADRPATPRSNSALHHRPKTFISPSPLSSTVTTVFKDGFLRENDNAQAPRSSLRRIQSSIRASLFFGGDEAGRGEGWRGQPLPEPEDLVPQSADELHSDGEARDPARRRTRSISDALGDFFQSKRRKRDQAPPPGDVEHGAASDAGGGGRL